MQILIRNDSLGRETRRQAGRDLAEGDKNEREERETMRECAWVWGVGTGVCDHKPVKCHQCARLWQSKCDLHKCRYLFQ